MLGFWLLFVLLCLFVAALPVYPYSRRWGYGPSGAAFGGFLVALVLVWLGLILFSWPWAVVMRAR